MKKLILLIVLLFSIPAYATVSTGESIREPFSPDGANKTFTFTQPCNSADDIKVYKQLESTGVETLLTVTTDYTIAPTGGDYLNGGVVTIDPAMADTFQLIILREIQKSQETAQGAITPTSIVAIVDKLTRIVQDLEDRNDRSLHLQESDSASFDMEIPGLALRASSYLFWDALGNPTYVADLLLGSETASVFGVNLMQAATAAAGVLVLELGTTDAVEFAGITGTTGTFAGAVSVGGTGVTLDGGADLLGSATSDITINTNKFTVAGSNGNTLVAGTLDVTGKATLGDTSVAVTQGASDDSTQIATTQYVDDQIDTDIATAVAGAGFFKVSALAPITGIQDAGGDFDDLDLSGAGGPGAAAALVFLEVECTTAAGVATCYIKPKAFGGALADHLAGSSDGSSGGDYINFAASGEFGFITTMTDSAGKVQFASLEAASVYTVTLLGYIK